MLLKNIFSFLMIFSTLTLFAQVPQESSPSVSDTELEQFASAVGQVQMVNQAAQQQMAAAISEEGLSVEKFNEIQQAEQNPTAEVEANDDQREQYTSCMKSIKAIQMKAQEEMQEKITAEGLSIEKYQEIGNLVQQDPSLQQKVQELIQG
ncbi:MAG: DUF4168 domain-containing protein [Salibacteraceae bacterium]